MEIIQPQPQCQHFVVRKKRLCRMTVRPGRSYCGEHDPQPLTAAGEDDTRVPCPYDSKHTCYVSKLERHLAICNARPTPAPPYIQLNVNAPSSGVDCERKPLGQVPTQTILRVVEKVHNLYEAHIAPSLTTLPNHPIHWAVLPEFAERGRTEASLRHLRQASSLLYIVEREGMVGDDTCYVELGAGKGQLSLFAWRAWCVPRSDVTVNAAVDLDARVTENATDDVMNADDGLVKNATNDHDDATVTENTTDDVINGDEDRVNAANARATENAANDVTNNEEGRVNAANARVTVKATDDVSNDDAGRMIAVNGRATVKATDDVINDDAGRVNAANGRATENASDDVINGDEGSSCVLLVDRAALRHKRDAKMRAETPAHDSPGAQGRWCRVRADLAHVVLRRVPVCRQRHLVGLAKHLCGAATDFALRCLVGSEPRGGVLATCCHHRCEIQHYTGTTHLMDLGISPEELNVMLGIVSWATCGDGRARAPPLTSTNGHGEAGDTLKNGSTPIKPIDEGLTLKSEDHDRLENNDKSSLNFEYSDVQGDSMLRKMDAKHEERCSLDASSFETKTQRLIHLEHLDGSLNATFTLNDYKNSSDGLDAAHRRFRPDSNSLGTGNKSLEKGTKLSKDERSISRSNGSKVNDPYTQLNDTNSQLNYTNSQLNDTDSQLLDVQTPKLSQSERAEAGRRAKALLDWGRVLYLRRHGFDAKLCHFVPTSVSLENVCIVAKKPDIAKGNVGK